MSISGHRRIPQNKSISLPHKPAMDGQMGGQLQPLQAAIRVLMAHAIRAPIPVEGGKLCLKKRLTVMPLYENYFVGYLWRFFIYFFSQRGVLENMLLFFQICVAKSLPCVFFFSVAGPYTKRSNASPPSLFVKTFRATLKSL